MKSILITTMSGDLVAIRDDVCRDFGLSPFRKLKDAEVMVLISENLKRELAQIDRMKLLDGSTQSLAE